MANIVDLSNYSKYKQSFERTPKGSSGSGQSMLSEAQCRIIATNARAEVERIEREREINESIAYCLQLGELFAKKIIEEGSVEYEDIGESKTKARLNKAWNKGTKEE